MAKTTGEFAKPRAKRPDQTGEMVSTRIQPDMLELIDAWRRAQPDLPSRPEALRRLAMRGLDAE
jgi:3-deoxy-D-arabino-heptulosonate 7-phosphate (DAHP) synthase class II